MFNKLFTKILDSSIWLEPTPTRIVWITLLAAMDEDGYAHFSAIENLASRARVTVEEAKIAIECFLAPDPNSGNPDNEGRRIERVPGGYMVLNAKAHRDAVNRIIFREQTRLRVARHRSQKRVTQSTVTLTLPSVTLEDEYASEIGKGSAEGKGFPTLEQAKERAKFIGVPETDAEQFWHHFNSTGWVDKNGHTIKNWESKLVTWKVTNQQLKYGNNKHGKTGQQTNPRLVGICRNPDTDYGKAAQQKVARQMAETENRDKPKPPGT